MSGFENPQQTFPLPVTFTAPVTIQNTTAGDTTNPSLNVLRPSELTSTQAAVRMQDQLAGGSPLGAHIQESYDHNGSPITVIPTVGGPATFGDNIYTGTVTSNVLNPRAGLVKDPGATANVACLALVDPAGNNHHLFLLAATPASGLGSNGDIAFNPAGASGARMYLKSGGAWSAVAGV